MAILPRELAKRFFPDLVDPLRKASEDRRYWSFVKANFPYVALRVTKDDGEAVLGLMLEARDWPHRPFSVRAARSDFRGRLPAQKVPKVEDEHGETHVYDDSKAPQKGAYFCIAGTREYHEDMAEAIPWESVRHLPPMQPASIVDACVDEIARETPDERKADAGG